MKNLSSTLRCLGLALASALALTSCNRAEYAMLPRSASYLGSAPVARQRPVAVPVASATTPVAEAASAPVAAPPRPAAAPLVVAAQSAPAVAEPTTATVAPQVAPATVAAATVAARAAAPKLNLTQRLALHKITKKLDKLTAHLPQLNKRDATASTNRGGISGNLRTGLVLLLIGLLVSLFSGVNGVFGLIGAILAIIGLVFIILWLLDQA